MQRDELAGWLRLALTPQIGAVGARRLLAAFGLPEAIFARSEEALGKVGGSGAAQALRQLPEELPAQLETTLAWLEQDRARRQVLTLGDTGYPAALLEIEDPPL